ncbi:ABC transporter ATP-binding protein [Modestobacter sp. VKM Ac-2978]|uniref:ABC transporter ATP-binding protein n=1 Tax=Modestobacter sp. VKM Ac-2978 TaxID=3004132 RepID=UPI0022AA01B9|nr:ABC transporter ATP-binding protein [Modestobacter sp. VKM Ac-2978]MCZ2847813.1 ABC transporter ATP-binding protein [Modestobacter sp. VKM Ac-2978]
MTMTTTAALHLDGVHKTYSSRRSGEVTALDDIHLTVGQGEFVSLVGPSGCGKSSLLKIVLGQSRPTRGTVTFGGELPAGRHRLGMVFQQALLLPWRTVRQNLLLSHDLNGAPAGGSDATADAMLTTLGLADFADKYPNELSGGMQQRVGIGRALVHDPQILMMDEPFGALDALTRDQLGMELLDIWERDRKTVLFVTHSVPESVLLSDRVVVMTPRPGRIAEIIDIDIPRPRRLESVNTPEFGEYVLRIRRLLNITTSAH